MKKILALDIATITGWKTSTASGIWNLKPNRGESDGMRVVRFKAKVNEMIKIESINLIAYERVAGKQNAAISVISEMVGQLKLICIEQGIDLACYSAKEIKKFATGNGNASKDLMVKTAIAQGYNPIDDNEADAIFIYNLTIKDIG